MKKMLIEYANIIGYTIIGIIFGFCCFLFFLNFYHYKEVSTKYIKQDSDYEVNDSIRNKISSISNNIKDYDINKYKGIENPYSLSNVQSRLNICIQKIKTEKLEKILNKKVINIQDVYEMQQFYQISISNECLVKELYDLTIDGGNNNFKLSSLPIVAPLFEDNIKHLIKSTDYVQKILKNNSSYYFSSDTSKVEIYNQTRDSYYKILNEYVSSIDFIYDVSVWFKNLTGGIS